MRKLIWLALLLPSIVFAQAEPATESGLNALTAAVEEQTPILEDIKAAVELLANPVAPVIPASCDPSNGFTLAANGYTLGIHHDGAPDLGTIWYSLRTFRSIKRGLTTLEVTFASGTLIVPFATVEEAAACRDDIAAIM